MTATHHSAMQQQLSQAWRDWTKVVQSCAEKLTAREQIQERAYREIHQTLTASLNGLVEQEPDSHMGDFYDQLNALVRPWMSLAALRDADPRISQNLLIQCQHCQSEIDALLGSSGARVCRTEPPSDQNVSGGSQPARSRFAWKVAGVFALFLAMFAVGLGSEFWSGIRRTALNHDLVDGLGSAWQSMTRNDGDVHFSLIKRVMCVVIGLTAWAVFRPPKHY